PPYRGPDALGLLVTTAPVILLAPAAAGAAIMAPGGLRARPTVEDRSTGLLLFLSGFVPMAPFFFGSTPIFGETKHWLATMPVLALAAGGAVAAVAARLPPRPRPRRARARPAPPAAPPPRPP